MTCLAKVRPLLTPLCIVLSCFLTAHGQIDWDGGDGNWVDGNWNGGQTAQEVFGRANGMEIGSGELSDIVNIASGNVVYDPNANGDFRFKPGEPGVPAGTLNLSGGSMLSMDSATDPDGQWTQFDGDALNLDNATFKRTQSGNSKSGGALIFGSWRSYENQVINVNLTNGGTIDNHGQVWFGAWGDNAVGLTVNMTINDGHLDLKGGFEEFLDTNGDGDLVFISGWQDFDVANGGGMAKDESYSVNFVGPGSISVSDAGIVHAIQDEFGDYNDTGFTPLSYQDLWNQGILQAHGFSGAKGAKFNGFFSVNGQVGDETYLLNSNVTDPTPIVWDGGDGQWNSGNWNGGQTAADTFKRNNGLEVGSGEIGWNVHINDGNVTYDPNANGDFRFRAGGTLNLSGGSSLSMDSNTAPDGNWTEFDGDAINIDNATLRRTQSGDSISGGALILGSWRSYEDQVIEVNLTNGGRIENHGQLWFGAWADNAAGLEVIVTIDDGHLDLTGGDTYDLLIGEAAPVGPGNADLIFINGYENDAPKDENYVINFTGPGSITVDKAGILNPIADGNDSDPASYGDTLTTLLSYEDLWDVGILKANGLSGLDGAAFTDFFSTSGSSGSDDYMLLSLLGGTLIGDCNGDGVLDADDLACVGTIPERDAVLAALNTLPGDLDGNGDVAFPDFLVLSTNFNQDLPGYTDGNIDLEGGIAFSDFLILSTNFNKTPAGAVASVPEPGAATLVVMALVSGLMATRRRRA